jgi:hypothetical protein
MEGDVITLQDLFIASHVDDTDPDSTSSKLTYTGVRPGFLPKLESHGVSLPNSFFAASETGAKVDVLRRGGRQRRTA